MTSEYKYWVCESVQEPINSNSDGKMFGFPRIEAYIEKSIIGKWDGKLDIEIDI